MKRDKKIPSILGLVLLLVAMVGGVYLTNQKISFNTKASGDCQPVNPQVTNITHQSVDISFTTSASCLATVSSNNLTVLDVRNSGGKSDNLYKTHYFEVRNLTPKTQYTFKIVSGGTEYSLDSFRYTTNSKPSNQANTSNLAWGKVLTSGMTPAKDAIVYVTIPGALPLSAFVTSNGNWNISFSHSFSEDKASWFTPPDNTEEDILVLSEDNVTTQVVGNTAFNTPVPDIIVGQNSLSFVKPENQTGNLSNVTPGTSIGRLSIKSPAENEVVSSARPQIFGTAKVSEKISLTLDSSSPSELPVGSDGSWSWSPASDLPFGSHTIKVSQSGEAQTRVFLVDPSKGMLSFNASQSASTPTPSPVPTTTPTLAPVTPTPTIAISITPTLTIQPTSTLKPTITPKPSTSSAMPITGYSGPTVMYLLFAFGFIALSVVYAKQRN